MQINKFGLNRLQVEMERGGMSWGGMSVVRNVDTVEDKIKSSP